MKKQRRLLAAVLLLSMTLTLFSGGLMSAFAVRTVTTGSELAYDPLAEAASIAYEEHGNGYAVSLDRAADSVTMNITAAPKSGRTADKAQLYVRTGVALKPGTTYQVSFALSADKEQKDYSVSFDGDTTKAAYGTLNGRSIEAGGTDQVTYQIAPKKASGELILRLQLGKTEGNTFRFSNLAVEEAAEMETMGENKVLADKLDYSAPGAVSCWTNTGFRAGVTSTSNSTTLTVLDRPAKGEIWEVQLKMATGFKPEPGKMYRISATLSTSAVAQYEIALNEGSVEKGYDAIYGLWLEGKSQTFSRMLSIPEDKKDPGELSFQFNLGNLKTGDKVTVSNIRIVEASIKYSNALPNGFAFDKTWEDTGKEQSVSGGTPIETKINWDGSIPSATAGGAKSGGVTVNGNSATLKIASKGDPWEATLCIDTGESLEAGATYSVSYKITSNSAYTGGGDKVPSRYTTLFGNEGNDRIYDAACVYNAGLAAGTTDKTHKFTATQGGTLRLTFELGAPVNSSNEVTVSDLKIEKETDAGASGGNLASSVSYPTGGTGSFYTRDNFTTIIGDEDSESVTLLCPPLDQGKKIEAGKWGLFTGRLCDLENGKTYKVSFNISADGKTGFWYRVVYCKNGDWSFWVDGKNDLADENSDYIGANDNTGKFTGTITPTSDGELRLRIDVEGADGGSKVKISNIQVTEGDEGDNLAEVTYPTIKNLGSFHNRDNVGTVTGSADAKSITMTCPSEKVQDFRWGLFTDDLYQLKKDSSYKISFDITTTGKDFGYKVVYCKNEDWNFWSDGGDNAGANYKTGNTRDGKFEGLFTAPDNGQLRLRIDLGSADPGSNVKISNIRVQESKIVMEPVATIDGFTTSAVSVAFANNAGEGTAYEGSLIRHKDSAEIVTWKPDSSRVEGWGAKLCIDTGIPYEADKGYRFSFDITSPDAQREFGAYYNDVKAGNETGTWAHTLAAGETKTIVSHGLKASSGNVAFTVELGKFYGKSNSATISNVQVEEVEVSNYDVKKITGDVNFDAQPGYSGTIDRQKDSATLTITQTPSDAEFWKNKMFINTGIPTGSGQGFKISFDVLAEKDADFEVCYNQGDTEKGLGALYGLHAEAGKVQTITATCGASESKDKNDLRIQLNLGMVQGPNKITVSNLKIERGNYNFSNNNLAKGDYKAPGAISYWAHEDYTTTFTGSDKSITANVTPPAGGAEGWKVKLWVDTGVLPKPGKYYKITAKVTGKMSQGYEICYNNGGIENGFGNMGGLQLSGGKSQTVEKLISIPADKKDISNLTLQLNLGKTSVANAITVSDVKVEEVSLAYAEMMKGFTYTGSKTSIWTYNDYTAKIEQAADKAIAHITKVPSDAAVWKVKLFVNTGVLLQPGKTYQVSADMLAAKSQSYEVCYNNEEVEKGYDALYGQYIEAGKKTTVARSISVPESMTDAGELVLQFAVGGDVVNDITVSNVSVQELSYGAASTGTPAPDTVINLNDATGKLAITREKLTYKMAKILSDAKSNEISIAGADLRADDLYTVNFTAKANKELTGTLVLRQANGKTTVISEPFQLTTEAEEYSFTTKERLAAGGAYDILWQFGSADNQKLGSADVEISNITVYAPSEVLEIMRSNQKVTVNGKAVKADIYNINGSNYFKLRDLAMMLNDTDGQFVVRYNAKSNSISLTTGKAYTPVGGELTIGADRSATCVRSPQDVAVNGKSVNLKAYNIGGSNFFRLRDLNELLGFKVDYAAASNTVLIASPLTPEAQEKKHTYDLYFLPELDGEAQAYVGDTMPYYENGTYYIYYLKDGGDSYNHSVYVASTKDFVHYTDHDNPVLSASREDVQDNWIGTGSVVKVDKTYYFFYTGFNSSGSQEYHEKIMVAKSSSPTGTFEKVKGWEIVPPASLGQKNDFRDPQAYYDPATKTISLTITASQEGKARILKYTLSKDLQSKKYDGIIFTDPTGAFWNLECSDTFKIGNKWYLTYSGQDDTLWYAMADSRFGPYTNATRMEGKLFYAAKHVENGKDSYMVGWARRSNSASSTQEINGWAGNIAVQKLRQNADGSLTLVPVDSVASAFSKQKTLSATQATLTANSNRVYKAAFTSDESFMLKGEFTYSGRGSFGLAFDFNGQEDQYKLISMDPATGKLNFSLQGGAAPITEMQTTLRQGQKYSFTYIQDGSVGIFYLDGQAALTVRVYGATDKPIYLFAENNNVTFTSLRQYTR